MNEPNPFAAAGSESAGRPGRRVRHELRLRVATVLRVESQGPSMRRVTLGGDDLRGFVSAAPDDHVKVFFPLRPGEPPLLPSRPMAGGGGGGGGGGRGRGGGGGGHHGHGHGRGGAGAASGGPVLADGSEGPRPVARDYTPRRYDAARGELELEFVLHGEGPAAAWAAQAAPGQQLGIGGPRGSFVLPDDLDWYLMIGDETALPAIGRWLEELHAGRRALVVAQVASAADELPLRSAATLSLQWLHRGDVPPGDAGQLLQAARALTLPPGRGYIWIAGESNVSRALREHFVGERGFDRLWIKAAGYWKQGEAAAHETHDD